MGRRGMVLMGLVAAAVVAAPAVAPVLAAEQPPPRIVVVGTGRVQSAPDKVDLGFAVEHNAATAAEARSAAAASARKVLDALTKAAGSGARVETAGYALHPVYKPNPEPRHSTRPEPPEIVGYKAVHQIQVESREIDGVGGMIDAAVGAGAARIHNLAFTLRDPADARDRALAAAGADAARQAEVVAKSLGVRVTKVLEASAEGGPRPMYAGRARAMAVMDESARETPVAPGIVTTEVRVHVTYGIE